MANVERYGDLIIGSGIAGKFAAWTRASRRGTAIVERGLLGGACPKRRLPAEQEPDLVCQGNLPRPARNGVRTQD